ncbi:ATP-binding cassette domain-containing protein [Klebsiella pneumoniae]
MLKLNDVTWLYQHLPMRFTLDVARGERIAVLGPSGAGKSTLLNLIAGFLPPASGSLLINGEAHNAALARCLVRQQPVLLLDEPFSALDPALRQEMLSLVADVCEQQQLTLLMVSHSVEDASRIAPRSMVVAEGRIVWDGATAELLSGHSSASHLMGISAR